MENFRIHNQLDAQHRHMCALIIFKHTHIVHKKEKRQERNCKRVANIIESQDKNGFIILYFIFLFIQKMCYFNSLLPLPLRSLFYSVLIHWLNTLNLSEFKSKRERNRNWLNCHGSDSIHSIISNGFSKTFSSPKHYGAFFSILLLLFEKNNRNIFDLMLISTKEMKWKIKHIQLSQTEHPSSWKRYNCNVLVFVRMLLLRQSIFFDVWSQPRMGKKKKKKFEIKRLTRK